MAKKKSLVTQTKITLKKFKNRITIMLVCDVSEYKAETSHKLAKLQISQNQKKIKTFVFFDEHIHNKISWVRIK